jgi:hypothetical protein
LPNNGDSKDGRMSLIHSKINDRTIAVVILP